MTFLYTCGRTSGSSSTLWVSIGNKGYSLLWAEVALLGNATVIEEKEGHRKRQLRGNRWVDNEWRERKTLNTQSYQFHISASLKVCCRTPGLFCRSIWMFCRPVLPCDLLHLCSSLVFFWGIFKDFHHLTLWFLFLITPLLYNYKVTTTQSGISII